jgi:hypothetical protein
MLGDAKMHELRNAILAGESPSAKSVSTRETDRRQRGGGPAAVPTEGAERRASDQRSEDRHWGKVERAIVVFRRKKILVRVVNVSSHGLTVEAEIAPDIGEAVGIQCDGLAPLSGVVRWIRAGRIGIDVGEPALAID